MQEYTVTRYRFDELSETAREKAIKNMSDTLWNDLEYWLEESLLEKVGELLGSDDCNNLRLRYSFSYSQGDGASFTGVLTPEQAPLLSWVEGVEYVDIISIDTHYAHYNTIGVAYFYKDNEPWSEPSESQQAQEKVFTEQIKQVCRDLANYGYKLVEGATNEESAIEYIRENYADDFTIDGKYDPIYEKVGA